MKASDLEKPLSFRELKRLRRSEPEGDPPRFMDVNLASFKLPDCMEPRIEPRIERDWSAEGAYRLVARLPGDDVEFSREGLIRTNPLERIPTTPLTNDAFEQYGKLEALEGRRLSYSPMSYFPGISQLDFEIGERMRKAKRDEDRPTNIFGSDERSSTCWRARRAGAWRPPWRSRPRPRYVVSWTPRRPRSSPVSARNETAARAPLPPRSPPPKSRFEAFGK